MINSAAHIGMKIRLAISSLVYRKILCLSSSALNEASPGKIINLLSNDVSRFDLAMVLLNTTWIVPLNLFIVTCLLWNETQWAGLIGLSVILSLIPFQIYTGKLTSIYRLKATLKTDVRIRFMDEIISGMQVIKMYAWEKPFTKLITRAREIELKYIKKIQYIRALYMSLMFITTRVALLSTMTSIVLLYEVDKLTADRVFAITIYFNLISHITSQLFFRGVAEMAQAIVSVNRIKDVLQLDNKHDGIAANKITVEVVLSFFHFVHYNLSFKSIFSVKNFWKLKIWSHRILQFLLKIYR